MFEFTFCCSNGTVFWLYIAEITVDKGLGIAVFIRMMTLFILSIVTLPVLNKIGFEWFFFFFGGIQAIVIAVNHFYMKETAGLSNPAKKALYRPE
jgi:hypothetical protein